MIVQKKNCVKITRLFRCVIQRGRKGGRDLSLADSFKQSTAALKFGGVLELDLPLYKGAVTPTPTEIQG